MKPRWWPVSPSGGLSLVADGILDLQTAPLLHSALVDDDGGRVKRRRILLFHQLVLLSAGEGGRRF